MSSSEYESTSSSEYESTSTSESEVTSSSEYESTSTSASSSESEVEEVDGAMMSLIPAIFKRKEPEKKAEEVKKVEPEKKAEEVKKVEPEKKAEEVKEKKVYLADLKNQAKALGLKGYGKWNKQKLVEEIAKSTGDTNRAEAADKLMGNLLDKHTREDIKAAALLAGIKLTKYSKEFGRSRPKTMSMLKEELKQHVLNKQEEK